MGGGERGERQRGEINLSATPFPHLLPLSLSSLFPAPSSSIIRGTSSFCFFVSCKHFSVRESIVDALYDRVQAGTTFFFAAPPPFFSCPASRYEKALYMLYMTECRQERLFFHHWNIASMHFCFSQYIVNTSMFGRQLWLIMAAERGGNESQK